MAVWTKEHADRLSVRSCGNFEGFFVCSFTFLFFLVGHIRHIFVDFNEGTHAVDQWSRLSMICLQSHKMWSVEITIRKIIKVLCKPSNGESECAE